MEQKMIVTPDVELVNDIAVIVRVQGKIYASGEIFDNELSVIQMLGNKKMTQRAATLIGRHAAMAMKQWAAAMPLILKRDNLLVFGWSEFNRMLDDEKANFMDTVSAVPMDRDFRTKMAAIYRQALGGDKRS